MTPSHWASRRSGKKTRACVSTRKEFSLPVSSSADFTVEHSRSRIASVGLRYSPCDLKLHRYWGVRTNQRLRHSFKCLDCFTSHPSFFTSSRCTMISADMAVRTDLEWKNSADVNTDGCS